MATIPEITSRLEAATIKAEGASEIQYQVANADENTSVPTASGPTPSIKKWYQELGTSLEPMLAGIPERLNKAILVYQTQAEADTAALKLPDGQIISVDGSSIGYVNGGLYFKVSSTPAPTVKNLSDLSEYSGKSTCLLVADSKTGGFFVYDELASGIANGVTKFSHASGLGLWIRQYSGRVSALWSGAAGDGVADDTAALAKLVDGQFIEGVDGQGLTYKLNSRIDKTVSRFDWVNFKFTSPTTYTTPVGIKLTCDRVDMDEIYIDGGRGTYKTGLEPYTVFTSHNGTQSIEPSHPSFIEVQAHSLTSVVNIGYIHIENLCAHAGILVVSLGRVSFAKQYFKNCANKTSHVFHTTDNGATTNNGSTNMVEAYTEDCGILPTSFTVDGVTKSFSDNYALQGSFNLCVTFGTFTLGSAVVRQYGAAAVTADRNKAFIGGTIDIYHDHARGWSNNPSGAFWDEACASVTVDKLKISIQQRDPRDYSGGNDSSALQVYKQTGQKFSAAQMVINNNPSVAAVSKTLRFSVEGEADISINGFNMSGATVTQAYGCDSLPGVPLATRLRFSNGYAASGDFVIGAAKNLNFDNVTAPNSALSVIPPGNPGVTGVVEENRISGGSFKSVSVSADALSFQMNENYCYGNVDITGSHRRVAVNGNSSIAGNVHVLSALTASVNDNTYIGDRVKIDDVRLFSVSNNAEIRSGAASPCVWLSPAVETNVKGGTIIGNNLTVTTGTVGAGFVSVPASLSSLVKVDNNTETYTDA